MKKHLIFIILLSLSFNFIGAQTLETTEWGIATELPKFNVYQKIIGGNDDGIYALRTENNDFYLDFISSLTLTVDIKSPLLLPSVGSLQTKYEEIFFLDNKIILFTSVVNKMLGKKLMYIMYVNSDGTLKNKPKKVAELSVSNAPEDDFEFMMSPDEKNIYLYYHTSFKEYNDEPFTFKAFNSSLQEISSVEVTIPLKERGIEITKYEVGKSGNIYMMAKAKQKVTKRSRSKGDVFDYVALAYDVKSKLVRDFTIKLPKVYPANATFGLDAEENIVVMGFTKMKTSRVVGQTIGAFYRKFNPRINKEILINPKFSMFKFDRAAPAEFMEERNGLTSEQQYSYGLLDIAFLANGTVVLISEQQYQSFRPIIDPNTKSTTIMTYYNFNDIFTIGINKKGKMEWVKRIPKNHNSFDDKGYYHSFSHFVMDNKIKYFLNDVSKNKKGIPTSKIKTLKNVPGKAPKGQAFVITSYTDGSYEKDPMFLKKNAKITIVPKLVTRVGESYYFYGQQKNKYRFGKFIVE